MQPALPISQAVEVTNRKCSAIYEPKYCAIHIGTKWLHQIIDQAIAVLSVSMQEAARHVEAGADQRPLALAFQHTAGVVEDGVHRVDGTQARR